MTGIYVASKAKYGAEWRALRALGYPIISSWIDEAGEGETGNWPDLWNRCISEASSAAALVLICREGDVLKGGWVEVGAALAAGRAVYAVGIAAFSVRNHPLVKLCETEAEAFNRALKTTVTDREPEAPKAPEQPVMIPDLTAVPAAEWPVSISKMAGLVLSSLGISTNASLEPGADPRRDRIAGLIFQNMLAAAPEPPAGAQAGAARIRELEEQLRVADDQAAKNEAISDAATRWDGAAWSALEIAARNVALEEAAVTVEAGMALARAHDTGIIIRNRHYSVAAGRIRALKTKETTP